MTATAPPSRRCLGFTLVEMLVVLVVIAALLGTILPLLWISMRKASVGSTRTLMSGILAQISTYRSREVTVIGGGDSGLPAEQLRRLWDFDRGDAGRSDGILDGDPERDPGFAEDDRAAARVAGYRGFVLTSGATVPSRNLDRTTGRVIDAWRNPLRIGFSAERYGMQGIGIWSLGPDGKHGTADDIQSWKQKD